MFAATNRRKKVDTTVERGSGNVFADLGCSDAEGRLAKAELARAIHKLIVQRAWTQRRAADTLGLSAPDVSDLVRGKLARFSQERLERCLVALDMNVTIQSPRNQRPPLALGWQWTLQRPVFSRQ